MPIINNMKDLEREVSARLKKAMELTRDEIFQVISEKVSDYYAEEVFDGGSDPLSYKRTGHLMESLTASPIVINGNNHSFTVGWDDEYLEFTYPGWKKQFGRGAGGKNRATGEDILTYFNTGGHGGYGFIGDHNYWDEAIQELGYETGILNKFKNNCKKVGLPII